MGKAAGNKFILSCELRMHIKYLYSIVYMNIFEIFLYIEKILHIEFKKKIKSPLKHRRAHMQFIYDDGALQFECSTYIVFHLYVLIYIFFIIYSYIKLAK